MESSEDDAGNATSASCRASAREKDGLVENVEPSRSTQLEPPEASASAQTTAMSEDNFDGDSVPSPSAQDVNTSTEAILDMIDEFVDGPGAPKRLPFSVDSDQMLGEAFKSLNDTETKQPDIFIKWPSSPPPASIDKVETCESTPVQSSECTQQSEESISANTSSKIISQQRSSVSVDITETPSNQQQTENISAVESAEPEALSVQPVFDTPSSSIQNVQKHSNISACEESEQSSRTLKCVTSSDNRDSVTVERAESTSSECSVSESKELSVEPLYKSPLKRRLVRPAPGDKRPDSTVSSTVDSQAPVIHTTPSTSCDVIVKDVSSSSDAISLQHGNSKPEEISNVSEISICKAETSTAPKKIRLVRSKVIPALSNSSKSPEVVTPYKELCQSTSSDENAAPVFPVPSTATVNEGPKSEDTTAGVIENSIQNELFTSLNKQAKPSNVESNTASEEVPSEEPKSICGQSKASDSSRIQSELTSSERIHTAEPTKETESSKSQQASSESLVGQSNEQDPNSLRSRELLQTEKLEVNLRQISKSVSTKIITEEITPKQSQSEELNLVQAERIPTQIIQDETDVIERKERDNETILLPTEPIKNDSKDVTIENKSKDQEQMAALNVPQVQFSDVNIDSESKLSEQKQRLLKQKLTASSVTVPELVPTLVQSTKEPTESLQIVTEVKPILVQSTDVPTESSQTNADLVPTLVQSTDEPTESSQIVGELVPTLVQTTEEPTESSQTVTELASTLVQSTEEPTESSQTVTELVPTLVQSTEEPSESSPTVTELVRNLVQTTEEPTESSQILTVLASSLVQSNIEPTESSQTVTELVPTLVQSTEEPSESLPTVTELVPNLVQSTEYSQIDTKLASSLFQSNEERTESSQTVTELVPTLVQSTEEPTEISQVVTQLACTLVQSTEEPTESSQTVSELVPTLVQSTSVDDSVSAPPTESAQTDPQLVPTVVQSTEEPREGLVNEVPVITTDQEKVEVQIVVETIDIPIQPEISVPAGVQTPQQVRTKDVKSDSNLLNEQEQKAAEIVSKTINVSNLLEAQQSDSEKQGISLTKDIEHETNQSIPPIVNLKSTEPMEVDSIPKEYEKNTVHKETVKDQAVDVPLDLEKKLPPIKLTLTKVSKVEKKTNDLAASSTSKKDNALDNSTQHKPDLALSVDTTLICDSSTKNELSEMHVDHKRVPPIKLSISSSDVHSCLPSSQKFNPIEDSPDSTKQVPKLTIKLGSKQSDEMKPPVPKFTIKPIRPPSDEYIEGNLDNNQQIPNVTKINIKPVIKPIKDGERQSSTDVNDKDSKKEQTPNITKLNIKPIPKPAEKVNELHRKSSSSEISESEYSENDETSTSDQASASDQGPSDTVPKVTIKLGRPGTESEGKFYMEKNIPKLTIKGIQQNDSDDKDSKIKLVISQSEESTTMEKIPKLTIKTKTKSEGQPLSPKLTIKPIKPPENENEIPKLKITTDAYGTSSEIKENMQVPKLTIKAKPKTDSETISRTPKKSTQLICDSSDHIPTVTKLNIKPIMKPFECGETSEDLVDKIPVVSKLNIKPIVKPKVEDLSVENVPKIKKINIKPLKNPEGNSEEKDCDENVDDKVDMSIPVVTKLNIKPIVKPEENESLKDSENQSSETGTSSDENSDHHIPIVTKLNIKPIIKPTEVEELTKHNSNEQNIPVVTKLNIKPIIKPEENTLPLSPKKESLKSPGSSGIPTVTKLNIKPIVKPEENIIDGKLNDDNVDKSKNPPLVMKINIKNVCENASEQKYNNNVDGTKSPRQPMSPKIKKANMTPDRDQPRKNFETRPDSPNVLANVAHSSIFTTYLNCLPENIDKSVSKENQLKKSLQDKISNHAILTNEVYERKADLVNASPISPGTARQKKSLQNCTLLKQLLSNTKDDTEKSREMSMSNCLPHSEKSETPVINYNAATTVKALFDGIKKHNADLSVELSGSPFPEVAHDLSHGSKSMKSQTIQELRKEVNESVTKPLEIITDKTTNQSSGQDSPRIILKINKTDHGPSAKIITGEVHKPVDITPQNHADNTHEPVQEKPSPKKHYNTANRKILAAEVAKSLTLGKRLRSSRVVETPEKSPAKLKRNAVKRSSVSEKSPSSNKESDLSPFDAKRLKLEQLLSVNKGLTITPVASNFTQTSPPKPRTEIKQTEKKNHSLLNNDNSKNGNSKLHNILSNLQAKQMQTLQLSEATITKKGLILPDAESNTSTGSSDVIVEISRLDNCHPDVQEMIINENSDFRDNSTPDDLSQDPLEVDALRTVEVEPPSIKALEVTPTPRKRGRPRKIPLLEGATPAKLPTPLPVSALEERPQRSLRLMRERPAIITKPRGRGRGRGARRGTAHPVAPPPPPRPASDEDSSETVIVIETIDEDEQRHQPTPPRQPPTPPRHPPTPPRPATPEDPTSSRIKLPRMTEALDKSSACLTPLTSRRRSSDMKLFGEPSVILESPVKLEQYMKSPEVKGVRGRGGRGRGTPRGRTPRGRGRGRGGGKGATYMKETMGIYGRVCGPATTTVELFEEETCMMDDNATPKPSHLLDEDSQSSVKSSTNESSSKMKKSKFADLFDSNKVWTASDVKEYTWPPDDVPNVEPQVMMIQEQVAMFLGVKSFKRRYPEINRRAVVGEEKDYCLSRGIVTEALCDLGSTAVDASDVLDIMLSDYPHKYEEYRSYQRQKQLTESLEAEVKLEDKPTKIELKTEKTDKPEPPKVDPEKTRQDMAAAAIASAAEWNAMANAWRRPACVDLQSNTIHRRRPPPTSAPIHCRPPLGFYPHAILPGQFQHTYRSYTPEQLRYFPLNTVIAAPPVPPSPVESSSESEGSWADSSSSGEDSHGPHHSAKRKKLTKMKRTSQLDKDRDKDDSRTASAPEEVVDLCRVCKLRLEANRKYTHERFLVCAQCNAKLHPGCSELGADTIRKCREYPWQCSECKICSSCLKPAGEDKAMFCELCDRAHHLHCVGLTQAPSGRWHCVECSVCKSCGAREPSGLPAAASAGPSQDIAEWHHQTKRGPGGHKVYSHSLCTPCARAFRIGRYCPLCERSFIGPKGTMQLVICKLCDRQLHQECVRPLVAALNVLDYTCAECRRGGITSRAGAVRAAPRTIATLFMAKRRFNKYAHRQYMQSRLKDAEVEITCDRVDDVVFAPSDPETETCDASDPLDCADSRMSE